ncbi:MAG: hypothetical protein ACD_3C00109G0009 [uncultured bacterium (gcode 4)]|uniref:Ankyrin repeat protein n=1 Tax=uncultured bacterium (gcode 4) TaxID=1234023 RepID=K2GXC7_9BACT|nr:MAG: hypothetical protein ACD_3C00109G0009 [uncultured bacterium (gcode 4)]
MKDKNLDDIIWLLGKDFATLAGELWHSPDGAREVVDKVINSSGIKALGILDIKNQTEPETPIIIGNPKLKTAIEALKAFPEGRTKAYGDLISNSWNIDSTDLENGGHTALMHASFFWFTEIVEALLNAWADPFLLDFRFENNSYDLADSRWYKETASFLKIFMLEHLPDNILKDSSEIRDLLEFKFDIKITDIYNFCNFPDWTLGWIVRIDNWLNLPFAWDKLIREIELRKITDTKDIYVSKSWVLCGKIQLSNGGWFNFEWNIITNAVSNPNNKWVTRITY